MKFQNFFSSCPVVSHSTGSPVGWVDWNAVISFFCGKISHSKGLENIDAPESLSMSKADLERLVDLSSNHNIKKVVPALSQVKTLPLNAPARKALRLLSRGGQHQIPIMEDNKIVAVLSQRDVLNFFAEEPSRLGELGKNTIAGLELASHRVSTVRESDLAIDAFYSLAKHKFQGCGVVDKDGQLIKNLSVADMAQCKDDFTKLQEPVSHFVAEQHAVITCSPLDSLETVVGVMHKNRIRRVFTVNAYKNPTGVITLSDICKCIHKSMAPKEEEKGKHGDGGKKKEGKKGENKFKKHLEKEANKKGAKHSADPKKKDKKKKDEKKKKNKKK